MSRPHPVPRRPGLRPAGLLLLGGMSGLGPVSIDTLLPALPAIETALGLGHARAQLAIGALMAGFAIGTLVHGPLSDALGRRRPLLVALLLYAVASIAAALAPDLDTLVAARFAQGLVGSSGPVLARAILRDLHPPGELTRRLSTMTATIGLVAMLSPVVGAQVLTLAGWRAIPLVHGAYALAVVALALFTLAESLPPARRVRFAPLDLARGYGQMLLHRGVRDHLAVNLLSTAGFFVFLSCSPFVLREAYGIGPTGFGAVFALAILGLISGATLAGRLARRWPPVLAIRAGLAAALALALATALVAAAAPTAIVPFALAVFACMTATSFGGLTAMSGALAAAPERAGTVSALIGSGQFAVGAAGGFLASAVVRTGTGLALAIALALALALLAAFRLPRPAPEPPAAL